MSAALCEVAGALTHDIADDLAICTDLDSWAAADLLAAGWRDADIGRQLDGQGVVRRFGEEASAVRA